MKSELRVLSKEAKADLGEMLMKVPEVFPLTRDACRKISEEAWQQSSLEPHAIVSRLLWLVDPERKNGVKLFAHVPGLSAAGLPLIIVHPRDQIFALIQKKTGLDAGFLLRVYEEILTKGVPGDVGQIADLTEERILHEMKWWLTDLSFPDYYLQNTPPALMARQIMLNRSYELAGLDSEAYEHMKVSSTSPDGTATHWVHRLRSLEVEEEIERSYYAGGDLVNVTAYAPLPNILLYTVYRTGAPTSGADDFDGVSPHSFLELSDTAARGRYAELWRTVRETESIAVAHSCKEETGECRVMIGFPRGFINHFQANISRVMARAGIEVTRKYTATFGGTRPVIIASLYALKEFPADLMRQLVEVSLYPPGPAAALVESGALSPSQANLLNATVSFVHQFITVPDPDVGFLTERFRTEGDLGGVLATLQARIDRDTFPRADIERVFVDRPDIARDLWELFAARFSPTLTDRAAKEAAASARIDAALASAELVGNEAQVVRWAVRFVEAVIRTNFFLPVKGAFSFRLDSSFFARRGLESVPFGVFFVVGRRFHGFHVRFKDIARGGIRIVRSPTADDWLRNDDSLFDECFNLAFTQNKKNKDIPEGGSKGIILPALGATNAEADEVFHRYVNALLDLLLPGHEPEIVGWKEEILFLGPDEGTAHLMDWASQRARARGYRYWKGFTTGKDAALGGISHKEYAMTTQGVHRYVLGVLGKVGVDEASITKAQTGGPDGDLGSNEILISKDRTTVIVDGGGVLYDPDGLDRGELSRLARKGTTSAEFDPSKLGPRGFQVLVTDRDRTLSDGTKVASGLGFRNTFHLDRRMKADLFVPCGGRPRSISLTNWKSLLDENGTPLFRWIVEGANLFITQDARLKLEEKGVILFKDSSTNKGGVISSSYEVLAGLALTDEEYDRFMVVRPGGKIPAFRERYVKDVISIVTRRADQEFELLWKTHHDRGTPLSVLSETVSAKINEITKGIEESALFDTESVRRSAFRQHVPPTLLEQVGMDTILSRVPGSYQRAIFARSVASGFIYRYGVEAGFEDYRRYVEELASG
jgi:glutamate dehydrogenase